MAAPEKKTPPEAAPEAAPEVDDKVYGSFKAMMNKFITEREEEENNTPSRTPAAETAPKFDVIKSLFGG